MYPLFDCLINGTSFSDSGKKVSIKGSDLKPNEQVLFFRIDGCYIKDKNTKDKSTTSRKCDLLILYSDSDHKFVILSELKGKNIKDAVRQFEETVKNNRLKYVIDVYKCKSCNDDKCIKLFLVVHGGSISISTDFKDHFYREYGFFLEPEYLKCDLKKIIEKYKKKYDRKIERLLKKKRKYH